MEIKITWLEDPNKYDYLRVVKSVSGSPRFKGVTDKECKVIGMTKPIYRKGRRIYQKVVFYLKPYDRGMPREKECYGKEPINYNYKPSEGVFVKDILNRILLYSIEENENDEEMGTDELISYLNK